VIASEVEQRGLLQYLLQQFSTGGTKKKSEHILWSSAYGLGKELWYGIDAQQYINELRREQ